MRGVLKSLLTFLIVAAFGAATTGTAGVLPRTVHQPQALHQAVSGGQPVPGCGPVASEFTQHPASQHETHDKCIHPCCVSTSTAILAGVVRLCAVARVERDAFPIPDGEVLTGIAVVPLTGPPKLSA